MDKNLKIFILGQDVEYLEKVCQKVASNHSVEAQIFSNLKEFLTAAMQGKPDAFVISMSYPHPKTTRFPKFFKMAMSTPVIAFTEDTSGEFVKAVNNSQSDFKITSRLSPTNLWAKLMNLKLKKEQEAQAAMGLKPGKNSDTHMVSSSKNFSMQKSGPSGMQMREENMNLNAIMKQLENMEMGEIGTMDAKKNSQSVHIQSSDATKFKKRNMAEELAKMEGQNSAGDLGMTMESKGQMQHIHSSEGLNDKESNMNHVKSVAKENVLQYANGKIQEREVEISTPEFDDEPNPSFSQVAPEDSAAVQGSVGADGEDLVMVGSGSGNGIEFGEDEDSGKKGAHITGENELDRRLLGSNEEGDSEGGHRQVSPEGDDDGVEADIDITSSAMDYKNEADEMERERQRHILEQCCEEALKEVFQAHPLEEEREFDVDHVVAIPVNQEYLRGYILFSNSFNHKEDPSIVNELIDKLSMKLEEKGVSGDLQQFVDFEVPTIEYQGWAADRCDFNVTHEQETGKQLCLSFITRERVLPRFTDSEDKKMMLVDIQHIPPGTLVNFDAFIHLPRNNKYVRLLKKGRSLGLNQVKRLISEDPNKKLFIPRSEKPKFIHFFILNTVGWEFISYLKEKKKAS